MAVVRITHVSPPAPTNYDRLSLSPTPSSLSLVCISAAQPLKEQDPLFLLRRSTHIHLDAVAAAATAADNYHALTHELSTSGSGRATNTPPPPTGVGTGIILCYDPGTGIRSVCSRPEARSKIKRRAERRRRGGRRW